MDRRYITLRLPTIFRLPTTLPRDIWTKARNGKDANWPQAPIILHPMWKMKRKPMSRKLSIRKTIFNARNALKNLTRITRCSPIFVLLIHLRHYNARPNKKGSKFYWHCSAFLNHASSCYFHCSAFLNHASLWHNAHPFSFCFDYSRSLLAQLAISGAYFGFDMQVFGLVITYEDVRIFSMPRRLLRHLLP